MSSTTARSASAARSIWPGTISSRWSGSSSPTCPIATSRNTRPDLIAGTVPLGFQWLPNVLASLNSGGAKALAVASKTRMAALPDVPTTAEAGLPNYQASGWFTMLAPRGTPKPIVAKLNQELTAALSDPAVRSRMTEQGAEAVIFTPAELGKFMAAETIKWRDIITTAGIPAIQ